MVHIILLPACSLSIAYFVLLELSPYLALRRVRSVLTVLTPEHQRVNAKCVLLAITVSRVQHSQCRVLRVLRRLPEPLSALFAQLVLFRELLLEHVLRV